MLRIYTHTQNMCDGNVTDFSDHCPGECEK